MRTRKTTYQNSRTPVETTTQATIGTLANIERDDLSEIYSNIKSVPSYSAKIKDFLKQNETHSLHRRITKKRYPTRRIITHYPFQIFMADLIEYTQPGYQHANRGYKYILLMIDCFTKKIWTKPMKKKDKLTSANAMNEILNKLENHPNTIITDDGLEFFNREVREVLDRYGILHYSIKSDKKASMAERAIQTIKNRLEKYFYENHTKRWIDVIDQFTTNYNETPHRIIGMAPNHVTNKNRKKVFKHMFPNIDIHIEPRLHKGDIVRLLEKKALFDKGYKRSWSKELYTVAKVFQKSGIAWYHLEDQSGKLIRKTRYYWELNKVSP